LYQFIPDYKITILQHLYVKIITTLYFKLRQIMLINQKFLESAGAVRRNYQPSEIIFTEGEKPRYFYQIIYGSVKTNNYDESGKESIQNLLEEGDCFGETLLFMNRCYPMNAVALTDCEILSLKKEKFIELVKNHPKLSFEINKSLSQKLYFKLIMAQNMCVQNPKSKLITLMNYLKSFENEDTKFSFQIPLTRQQMANLTGMCVETVIRTVKKLERSGELIIENGKILY